MTDSPKEILRRHGLRAKKDWGQNFLAEEGVLSQIAAACSIGAGDVAVELGAGLGHLTRALVATGARVVAVERDRDLVKLLENELAIPGVQIVAGNAAQLDFAAIAGVEHPVVVGNLPYHLSSPILFQVIEQRARIRRAVFLLQKEVGERISALPGSRDYGILSVLLQAFARVALVFEVPAGRFHPPPKVDSVLVRMDMLEKPRADVGNSEHFRKLVKVAFAQRRKTLWNSLRAARLAEESALRAALERAGVDGGRRAETLSVEEFASLEQSLFSASSDDTSR
jgi:16S rRNA (adenine1518-N6/adenine1519-N6)-dimethyltransferase